MERIGKLAAFSFLSLLILAGCKKTIVYQSDKLTDFMPMQIGKYITYRLDSLKFIEGGTKDSSISYQAKDVVDDSITDNVGRPSWRVIRYLSDTTGTQPWVIDHAYMVTITSTDAEVVDDNLRYIKLVLPVHDGVSWLGNAYIDTKSDLSQVPYLDGWNYNYSNTGEPFNVNAGVVPTTVIVNQQNKTTGSDNSFSETDISSEVYGKGIGLIYKSFLHAEYQPPNASVPVGSTTGYGLTLNMIDHN